MDQEKVGSFIKKLRQDNNLTQAEFALKLGITYQAVSKWENGKNVPDIATLKEISKMFGVDIDEIISGELKDKSEKKNKNKLILISLILALILSFVVTFLMFHMINHKKDDLEINEITTTCEKFNVTGNLIKNNDKSYIRISNIEYCEDEDTVYKEIECTLYEKNGDLINKITKCDKGYNEKLKDHLNMVKLSANDYTSICSTKAKELYIEINAIDNKDKNITYKIPLEVGNTCN